MKYLQKNLTYIAGLNISARLHSVTFIITNMNRSLEYKTVTGFMAMQIVISGEISNLLLDNGLTLILLGNKSPKGSLKSLTWVQWA